MRPSDPTPTAPSPSPLFAPGLALAAALVLSACASSRCCESDGEHGEPPAGRGPTAGAADEWSVEVLARGTRSGIREFGLHAARDAATFADLWARHSAGEMPTPPLPELDLEHSMALFVTLGERPTAGYALEVVRVRMHGEQLVVSVREFRPSPDGMQAQVVTQPHVLLAIPRSDAPVALLVLPG